MTLVQRSEPYVCLLDFKLDERQKEQFPRNKIRDDFCHLRQFSDVISEGGRENISTTKKRMQRLEN
jgi:hypothetical protein